MFETQVFFNQKKGKSSSLINRLNEVIDKRKKYGLYIASCYLPDEKGLSKLVEFVKELMNDIKIYEVNFYIDARQVVKLSTPIIETKLLKPLARLFVDEQVSFHVVESENLFHTKALALIDNFDEPNGALFVGSSNFTSAGLFANKGGNHETGMLSSNLNDIYNFIESLQELPVCLLQDFSAYKLDSYTFQYSLVSQGRFVHKWQQTLQQYFAIRYELTEQGRREIGSEQLKSMGFDIDAETISKQFLQFDSFVDSAEAEELKNLRRKGIETYLGHWVPKSMIQVTKNNADLNKFYQWLEDSVRMQLARKEHEIFEQYQLLLEQGIIKPTSKKASMVFEDRLAKLRKDLDENDGHKLRRFLNKFEIFDLPYDFSCKSEIKDLYDILVESSQAAIRKKEAMKRINQAIEEKNPDLINDWIEE
jgi:hypothetical protein